MFRVFLGAGSNLHDRLEHLTGALREIGQIARVKAVSAVYQTEPYKMKSEHEFLNIAVEIETLLKPPELLNKLKYLERKLGRTSHTHMKDREIDIDILLYEGLYYEEHTGHSLEVPHPDLVHRKFALVSLSEIASHLIHPIEGLTIGTLLQQCTDQSKVERTSMQIHSLS